MTVTVEPGKPEDWRDTEPSDFSDVRPQAYVAGFLIDTLTGTVALVRKGKPAWQAGRLNAIGGKVEPGETAAAAMRREFREEAGLDIPTWEQFASVSGEWGVVWFFRAFGSTSGVRTMEDEEIEVYPLEEVPLGEALPNISWLLPLARYTHDRYRPLSAWELP